MKLLLLLLSATVAAECCTQIQDTVFTDFGSRFSGSLSITGPDMTTRDGRTVAQSTQTISITTGSLSLCVEPNDTATPSGGHYTVAWRSAALSWSENWVVPTSATPLPIAAVRVIGTVIPGIGVPLSDISTSGAIPGQVIGYNGSSWVATYTGAGFVNPLTTRGDLLYQSASGTSRLPLGSTGLVLVSTGIDASWGQLVIGAFASSVLSGNGTTLCTTAGLLTTGHVLSVDGAGNCVDSGIPAAALLLSTGSYSNPTWLTSIPGSIVAGAIPGNAAGLTGYALPTPTIMSYLDATSSIQTQINGKQATLGFTAVPNTRSIATAAPLTGGGSLSADLNLGLPLWGTGTRPVAAAGLGVVGNCAQWSLAGLGDTGAPCGSSGSTGANTLGYYLVQQSANAPANAFNLGALSTGLLKLSISGGVATPSIAVVGDLPAGYPYANLSGPPAIPAASTTTPVMDGGATVGTGVTYARADHAHPSDTSRAASNATTTVSGQTCALGGSCTVPVPAPSTTTPAMDGVATIGSSGTFARADHAHPGDATKVSSGVDINASNQVTATHLAAALPVLQGGTGITAGAVGKVLGGATPSLVTVTSAYVDNSIALTGTDINTSNQVTATHLAAPLPVSQGGTGTTTGGGSGGGAPYAFLVTTTASAITVGTGTVATINGAQQTLGSPTITLSTANSDTGTFLIGLSSAGGTLSNICFYSSGINPANWTQSGFTCAAASTWPVNTATRQTHSVAVSGGVVGSATRVTPDVEISQAFCGTGLVLDSSGLGCKIDPGYSFGGGGGGGAIASVGVGGTTQTVRPRINVIAGSNITITPFDNAGTSSTDLTFSSTGGGGGGGGAPYAFLVTTTSTSLTVGGGNLSTINGAQQTLGSPTITLSTANSDAGYFLIGVSAVAGTLAPICYYTAGINPANWAQSGFTCSSAASWPQNTATRQTYSVPVSGGVIGPAVRVTPDLEISQAFCGSGLVLDASGLGCKIDPGYSFGGGGGSSNSWNIYRKTVSCNSGTATALLDLPASSGVGLICSGANVITGALRLAFGSGRFFDHFTLPTNCTGSLKASFQWVSSDTNLTDTATLSIALAIVSPGSTIDPVLTTPYYTAATTARGPGILTTGSITGLGACVPGSEVFYVVNQPAGPTPTTDIISINWTSL